MSKTESTTGFEYRGRGVFKPIINIKEYLYKIIVENGPICRSELKELTGIPRTTIYDTVVKLKLADRVQQFSVSSGRGRPRVFYEKV